MSFQVPATRSVGVGRMTRTVASPLRDGSALLVATTRYWPSASGAVKLPAASMSPSVTVHVTDASAVPVTVAVNRTVAPVAIEIVRGATVTVISLGSSGPAS